MTAEPDLPINDAVPAPTKIEPGNLFLWNWRQMQVYAQACVAHAVAPLQAEIEALRAEVGELHMHAKRRDQYAVEKAAQALDWKKRAERLAETLRPHIEDLEQSAVVLDQYPAMAPTAAEMRKAAAELLAALEQEAGRG